MTKQALEARIAQLKEAQERNLAQYNVISGAIDECFNWLAKLEEQEKINKTTELKAVK